MQINITARHMKLTDSIDSYVREKITKVDKFYDADEARADVILSVEKSRQMTEIVFYVGKLSFTSKWYSYDLYTSIDLTLDKLKKQLRKQKEVLKIHRKDNLKVLRDKKRSIEEMFSRFDIENSKEKISEKKIRGFNLEIGIEKSNNRQIR